MPAPVDGPGVWVWDLRFSPRGFLEAAQEAKLTHVLLKAGDGVSVWDQFTPELVAEAEERGIALVAWVYAYLRNPAAEANVVLRTLEKEAKGVIIDVEYEVLHERTGGNAREYIDRIRQGAPDSFVGYSTDFQMAFNNRWPAGNWDPHTSPWPWKEFNTLDCVMPQLYWEIFRQSVPTTMDLATRWLTGCFQEGWTAPPLYPVLPTQSTPEELVLAEQYIDGYTYPGASLWRWGHEHYRETMTQLGALEYWDMVSYEDMEALRHENEELKNMLGYLQGDVADAIISGCEEALIARTLPNAKNAIRHGALPAAHTLRRGG